LIREIVLKQVQDDDIGCKDVDSSNGRDDVVTTYLNTIYQCVALRSEAMG
jgi:hypothetical protein